MDRREARRRRRSRPNRSRRRAARRGRARTISTFLDNPRYLDALQARPAPPRCSSRRATPRRRRRLRRAGRRRSPIARWPRRWRGSIPQAVRPGSVFGETGVSPAAFVHPAARLEPGVVVDPGAVIGPGAEIGAGALIGANAVIGPDVRIGRDCVDRRRSATVACALIGDRVIIHPGVAYRPGRFRLRDGAARPSQGAADRSRHHPGRRRDRRRHRRSTAAPTATRSSARGPRSTISCRSPTTSSIGRHCVLVAQAGVSGSTVIGDFVALGGQAGLAGHLHIGAGAQIAAPVGRDETTFRRATRWGGRRRARCASSPRSGGRRMRAAPARRAAAPSAS